MKTARIIILLLLSFRSTLTAQNHFGTVSSNGNVQNILASVSLDSLQKYIKQLSGIIPVNPKGVPVSLTHRLSTTSNFRTAADFIAMQFSTYGLNPVIENNASPWDRTNIIGTLIGSSNQYVLITGHFDSKCSTCPGADDNASGTAAVIEAARILHNYTFQRTIKFVAFGGEEQGLLGSKAYTAAHPNDSMYAVINCDMIMWDGDADLVMQIHAVANNGLQFSNDLADFIMKIDTVYNNPIVGSKVLPGITASDHSPFWTANRSAVLLIEEYGSDFNPYLHTANDAWANLSGSNHQNFFLASSKLAISSVAHLAAVMRQVPVELLSFEVHETEEGRELRWATVSETNNLGFSIERRFAFESGFSTLGFIRGNGTTQSRSEYLFRDGTPSQSDIFYRLKQIDTDGASRYSFVIMSRSMLTALAMHLYQNYPNPIHRSEGSVNATIPFWIKEPAFVTLTLSDALGRRIETLFQSEANAGMHEIPFTSQQYPAGLYFYTLTLNGLHHQTKMVSILK